MSETPSMNDIFTVVGVLTIVAAGPFLILWALNTLGAGIPWTFWTWLAALTLDLLLTRPWRNS